jgi:hypothetical protein
MDLRKRGLDWNLILILICVLWWLALVEGENIFLFFIFYFIVSVAISYCSVFWWKVKNILHLKIY